MTQRPATRPTPETVQEFKIITNNYSAEYGRAAGAVISVLSKSGTNDLHGHAWYYFRDERFVDDFDSPGFTQTAPPLPLEMEI